MTTALIRYEHARTALAECHRVDEVKDIRDKAEAMAAYARLAKDTDLIKYATEIKVRAERKCGELLSAIERAPGNRTDRTSYEPVTKYQQALTDNDLNHMAANRFQQLARMPEEHFETAVATAKESAGEVTTAYMLREAEKIRPPRTPSKKLSKKDKEGIAEIDRLRAIGVSLLTSYARPLLALLRTQPTFTETERELLAELADAIHNVNETEKG